MASDKEKTLNTSGVLAMLHEIESDYDDTDVDPDYKDSEDIGNALEDMPRRQTEKERQPKHSSATEEQERLEAEQRELQDTGEQRDEGMPPPPIEEDENNTANNGRRKRQSNPKAWKKNKRKAQRVSGQEYIDTKGNMKAARAPQQVNCQTCRFKCSENICEEIRLQICSEYWQLADYSCQRDFLLSNIKVYNVQRQRNRGERQRAEKNQTIAYFFKEKRVCKNFFLKTLNIGHGPLDTALKNRSEPWKQQSNPKSWKKNKRKAQRVSGQEYIDTKGNMKAAKAPQQVNCRTCRFKCSENISEEIRLQICSEYWQLADYSRQRDFLLSNIKVYNIQRQRNRGERQRAGKNQTIAYFFKEKRVCKNFFLKTLNIGHGPLDTALKNRGETGSFIAEDWLPVTVAKKGDLLKLCNQHVIPTEVHEWFAAEMCEVNFAETE